MFYTNLKNQTQEILELRDLQHEMLFSIEQGIYDYNEKVYLELSDVIDEKLLKESLKYLIKRHPALRTIFRWKDLSKPIQIVLKHINIPLYVDSSERSLSIEHEPWYIKLDNNGKKMELHYSHIIMDGWSVSIFFKQLFDIYNELDKGKEVESKERKYIKDLNIYKNDNEKGELSNYWKNYLNGYDPVQLLDYFPINEVKKREKFKVLLSKDLYKCLLEFSNENRVTVSNILYSAWIILIKALTGNLDVCTGFVTSGRNNGILDMDSIGLFINDLPLRVNVVDDVKVLIQSVSETITNVTQNEIVKYNEIFTNTKRGQKKSIYDNLFVVENYPVELENLNNYSKVKVEKIEFEESISYPLVAQILQRESLELYLSADGDLTYEHLEVIAHSYISILDQIVIKNIKKVKDISILSNVNKQLIEWQRSDIWNQQLDNKISLASLIVDACNKYSDKIAIIDGDYQITYGQLLEKSVKVARYLKSIGVREGSTVAVSMNRSHKMLICTYGILMAGATYVPLDLELPENRIISILNQSGAEVVIGLTSEKKNEYNGKIIDYDIIDQIPLSTEIVIEATSNKVPAYIFFTSGTSGTPKGIQVSHSAIINRLIWNRDKIIKESTEIQLFKTPITFDVSLIEIFAIFFSGNKLVVLPNGYEKMPEKILEYIEKYKITCVHFVPSMFKEMINYVEAFDKKDALKSLNKIICSGEVLHYYIVNRFYQTTKYYDLDVYNLYGPTEAAVDVSYYLCKKHIEEGIVPIGSPIYNTELRVLSSSKETLPPEVIGELYILGANLADGYINNEDLTNAQFVTLSDGLRAYRTGDVAYWNSKGELIVTGRLDNQIKYNGIRIECEDIKSILLKSGEFSDVEVVLNQKKGNQQLIAFYTGTKVNIKDIKHKLSNELPNYMMPSDFLNVQHLPYSVHGKLLKSKLVEEFENQVSKTNRNSSVISIENLLIEIWSNLLSSTTEITSQSDFFELGGTSIMIINMVYQIKKKLGISLTTNEIYTTSKLSNLADLIESRNINNTNEEYYDTSVNDIQRGMAAIQLLQKDNTAYNLPVIIKLKPNLQSNVVWKSLNNLVKENENLRTVFRWNKGELEQEILKFSEIEFKETNIDKDLEFYKNQFVRPFRLDELLLRFEFLKADEQNRYLLFDIHHIICDYVTLHLLMEMVINTLDGKEVNKIKSKPSRIISEDKKGEARAYWMNIFNQNMQTPPLPGDINKNSTLKEVALSKFMIDEVTKKSIDMLAEKRGVTGFQVLYACFFIMASKYINAKELVVGTNVVNRNSYKDLDMNLQVIPLKMEVDGGEPFFKFLKRLHNRFKDALKYNSFSYGNIVNSIDAYKENNVNPIFEMMFFKEYDVIQDIDISRYFESVDTIRKDAKFDFSVSYVESNTYEFCFSYNKNLYSEDLIKFYINSYQNILHQVLKNNEIRYCDLKSEFAQEKKYLRGETVDLGVCTIQNLFDKQCLKTPDAIAVYGQENLTYKEIYEKANRVANSLSTHNVEGKIVAFNLRNRADMLIAAYGILKAGAIYLPLDDTYPKDRLKYVLDNSEAQVLISDNGQVFDNIKNIDLKKMVSWEDKSPVCKGDINSNAYCIYTSGSTGKPKGCVITQRGAINYLSWANKFYCSTKNENFAFFTSPAVDMTVTSMLMPLLYGHSITTFENNVNSILDVIQSNRVTIFKATPSHFKLIDRNLLVNNNIRKIIIGGEQLTGKLAQDIDRLFEHKVSIFNEYGPTEATVGCICYKYESGSCEKVVAIGAPIQNTDIYILDENMDMCSAMIPGELYVSGVGVIDGYRNSPNLTKEKFIMKTEDNSYKKKMYATGDIVRIRPTGILEYIGRKDQQIKINGFRIELEEIANIAQGLPDIEDAIAVVEEGKNKNKVIVLYYKLKKAQYISENDIRKNLINKLPYYMMPTRIIEVNSFSIGVSGKLDLSKKIGKESTNKVIQNISEIEEFLQKCWEEVLGHSNFDYENGFFESGGNSLSVAKLHELIKERYEIEVMDLFRYPTIRSLSEYIKVDKGIDQKIAKTCDDKFAIVGLAFKLPGANNLEELRTVFQKGNSMMALPKGQRLIDEAKILKTKGYSTADYRMGLTANLSDIDLFDNEFFKINMEEAEVMDPAFKLFLSTTTEALYNAGYNKNTLYGLNMAIIGAKTQDTGFLEYLKTYYPEKANIAALNSVKPVMLSRLQHLFNLRGPSYLVDSACSSGLVALHNACMHLKNGECDIAVVGGVNLIELADIADKPKASVLSPNFHANAFSDHANGTARGEGVISFVVKRLEDAKAAEDVIYATIEGSAINNDGLSSSITAPNGLAQSEVIKQALINSNLKAAEVGLIETHGTATKLGDPIELQALSEVFKENTQRKGFCAVSSSKAIYGHMDSISGLLGVLKAIVSFTYKELYSNNQIIAPNRKVDFITSPFYIPSENQYWIANDNNTRVCGVSNFGLSGTNAHVILQQWPCESDDVISYVSLNRPEFNLKRCWIDDESSYTRKYEKAGNNRLVTTQSLDGLREEISNKVKKLITNSTFDLNMNFYELGFDSITIIQIQQFIKQEYAIEIGVENLFGELNSIEKIAQYIYSEFSKENKKVVEQNKAKITTSQNHKESPEIKDKVKHNWNSYNLKCHMNEFAKDYIKKTNSSYELMNSHKMHWANGRFIMGQTKGLEMLNYPIIVEHAKGSKVTDIDGNEYLDFSMGFGANLFGYNNQEIAETVQKTLDTGIVLGPLHKEPFRVAKELSELTGVERVSFCNSGTEAIMNLIRIARAYTGRDKIVLFENSFHGTLDNVFVQKDCLSENHKVLPKSLGTQLKLVDDTFMFKYGDEELIKFLENNSNEVAAVLVEPVQSRNPGFKPKEYIKKLREVTKNYGVLLIFDEVITGFRSGYDGAQGFYDVEADLVSYGKVIGGGFPIGVFGGKSEYMDIIDHKGWSKLSTSDESAFTVNTGGTFNGHPATIAAVSAVIKILRRDGDVIYKRVNRLTSYLAQTLNDWFIENNIDIRVEYFCSQFIFISQNIQKLRLLQYKLIYNSIYVWEGGTCFLCSEHTEEDINHFIDIVKKCCIEIKSIFNDYLTKVKISEHLNLDDLNKLNVILEKIEEPEAVYVLTNLEKSMITTNILNRRNKLDVSYMHFKTSKELDVDLLIDSFKKTIMTSEYLKMAFYWRGLKEPVGIVHKEVTPKVATYFGTDKIEEIIEIRKNEGFKIEKPPFMCMDIFIKDDKTAEVLIFYYTSLIDGWSMDEFLERLGIVYSGVEIIEESFDRQSYINSLYNSTENKKNYTIDYWKEHFRNFKLPNNENEYIHPLVKKVESITFKISDSELKIIENISLTYSISKASILLFCYAIALQEKDTDIILSTTGSGRNLEFEGMLETIGLYSHIMPLRVNLDKEVLHNLKTINSDLLKQNKLQPLIVDEIAKEVDIDTSLFRKAINNHGMIFLNQASTNQNDQFEICKDQGFLALPLRSYVTLGEKNNILIVYSADIYSEDVILKIKDKFSEAICYLNDTIF